MNVINLDGIKNYKYVGIRRFKEKENNLYTSSRGALFTCPLNEHIEDFFKINDNELRRCEKDTIFIGKGLDTNKIKSNLIERGVNDSDIVIIDNLNQISLPVNGFSVHFFQEIIYTHLKHEIIDQKNIRLEILFDFLLSCIQEVKNENIENFNFFDNKPITLKLKEIYKNLNYEFQGSEYDTSEITEINDEHFKNNIKIFNFISDIMNMMAREDTVIGKYKNYIINIDNLNTRQIITSFFRGSNIYQRSGVNKEYKKAFFCIDFSDFFIEGFCVPACTENNGFNLNVFFDENYLFKSFEKEKLEEVFYSTSVWSDLVVIKNSSRLLENILKTRDEDQVVSQ